MKGENKVVRAKIETHFKGVLLNKLSMYLIKRVKIIPININFIIK